MDCRHCRRELPDQARYCPTCGYSTRGPLASALPMIGLALILFGALLLAHKTEAAG